MSVATTIVTSEVKATSVQMQGIPRLMAALIYGARLRIHGCVSLRIKDIALASWAVSVRNRKGSKDRTMVVPDRLV